MGCNFFSKNTVYELELLGEEAKNDWATPIVAKLSKNTKCGDLSMPEVLTTLVMQGFICLGPVILFSNQLKKYLDLEDEYANLVNDWFGVNTESCASSLAGRGVNLQPGAELCEDIDIRTIPLRESCKELFEQLCLTRDEESAALYSFIGFSVLLTVSFSVALLALNVQQRASTLAQGRLSEAEFKTLNEHGIDASKSSNRYQLIGEISAVRRLDIHIEVNPGEPGAGYSTDGISNV